MHLLPRIEHLPRRRQPSLAAQILLATELGPGLFFGLLLDGSAGFFVGFFFGLGFVSGATGSTGGLGSTAGFGAGGFGGGGCAPPHPTRYTHATISNGRRIALF
jgi:hypothetical protein